MDNLTESMTVFNVLNSGKARYLAKLGYDPVVISKAMGIDESIILACLREREPKDAPIPIIEDYEGALSESMTSPEESVAGELAQVGMPEQGRVEEYIESICLLKLSSREELKSYADIAEYLSRSDIPCERQLMLSKMLITMHDLKVESLSEGLDADGSE